MATKRLFVAARYGPSFEFVREVVAEAARKAATIVGAEIEVLRPDQLRVATSATVIDTIRDWIRGADLIVADLSGGNPNVMWETGFAQASGKAVLLLSEDIGHVPFDLRDRQILLYQPHAPVSNVVARVAEALVDLLREPTGRRVLGSRRRRTFRCTPITRG